MGEGFLKQLGMMTATQYDKVQLDTHTQTEQVCKWRVRESNLKF